MIIIMMIMIMIKITNIAASKVLISITAKNHRISSKIATTRYYIDQHIYYFIDFSSKLLILSTNGR